MLSATLYPFQDSAVDKAIARESLLIAYEMGLGKTVISIATIEELLGDGKITNSVIVVPASLKYQWAQQIAKLTDVPTQQIEVRDRGEKATITVPTEKYCIIVADGGAEFRAAQYKKAKETRPDYLIIGYENVINDWNYVRRIKPDCIVLDEATAIKTFKAKRARKIKRLTAPFRYAMSGAPIENGKPEEIFSIMQWVDDTVLGRWDLFDRTYIERNHWGGAKRYKNLHVLHDRLAEAMVRKTREDADVKPFLPEVQEKVFSIAMDVKTRAVYKKISRDLLKELQQVTNLANFDLFTHYHGGPGDENSQTGKIMAMMGAIDMLLDHPDLIVRSGKAYEDSKNRQAEGEVKKFWPGSKYCYDLWQSGLLEDLTSSSKLNKVVETITEILDNSPANKVVLFSFYKDMLSMIADRLPEGVSVIYSGDLGASAKASAIQRFTTDAKCRVFLSSHAGAFGTDLWMANYLLNYDLAWSSGKQDQINKRHDRANSLFDNIFIINFVTDNSTEQRKYNGLAHKRRVGSAILDNRGADALGSVENDLQSLTKCLEETT